MLFGSGSSILLGAALAGADFAVDGGDFSLFEDLAGWSDFVSFGGEDDALDDVFVLGFDQWLFA
jgi:hypothetical protein